eukprot:scaffold872_cov421-Prasinococcus_capsulatus_cf.AAC.8
MRGCSRSCAEAIAVQLAGGTSLTERDGAMLSSNRISDQSRCTVHKPSSKSAQDTYGPEKHTSGYGRILERDEQPPHNGKDLDGVVPKASRKNRRSCKNGM